MLTIQFGCIRITQWHKHLTEPCECGLNALYQLSVICVKMLTGSQSDLTKFCVSA